MRHSLRHGCQWFAACVAVGLLCTAVVRLHRCAAGRAGLQIVWLGLLCREALRMQRVRGRQGWRLAGCSAKLWALQLLCTGHAPSHSSADFSSSIGISPSWLHRAECGALSVVLPCTGRKGCPLPMWSPSTWMSTTQCSPRPCRQAHPLPPQLELTASAQWQRQFGRLRHALDASCTCMHGTAATAASTSLALPLLLPPASSPAVLPPLHEGAPV